MSNNTDDMSTDVDDLSTTLDDMSTNVVVDKSYKVGEKQEYRRTPTNNAHLHAMHQREKKLKTKKGMIIYVYTNKIYYIYCLLTHLHLTGS